MLTGYAGGVKEDPKDGQSGWQEDRRVNVHFCAMVEKPAASLRLVTQKAPATIAAGVSQQLNNRARRLRKLV